MKFYLFVSNTPISVSRSLHWIGSENSVIGPNGPLPPISMEMRYCSNIKQKQSVRVSSSISPQRTQLNTELTSIVPIDTVTVVFINYKENHAISANFVKWNDDKGRIPNYRALCWNPCHGFLELLYH